MTTETEELPPLGKYIECAACAGKGLVTSWSFGVKEPDECDWCYGSGRNWLYPSGKIAKHYAGPFIGHIGQERGL